MRIKFFANIPRILSFFHAQHPFQEAARGSRPRKPAGPGDWIRIPPRLLPAAARAAIEPSLLMESSSQAIEAGHFDRFRKGRVSDGKSTEFSHTHSGPQGSSRQCDQQ
jgi:hypothetical protein